MAIRAFAILLALLQLLYLILLDGDLPQPAVDFPEGFTLFPYLPDPGSVALSLQAAESDALLVEPNPLLLPIFVF